MVQVHFAPRWNSQIDSRSVRDVDYGGECPSALGAQYLDGAQGRVTIDVEDSYPSSLARQVLADRKAQAGSAPSDHCYTIRLHAPSILSGTPYNCIACDTVVWTYSEEEN